MSEMSEGEVVAGAAGVPLKGAALKGAFHDALLKELQKQAATPALGRDMYDGWLDERVVQRASQDDSGMLGESKGEIKDAAREAMPGDSLGVLKAKARQKAEDMLKLELQNHKLIAANDLHPRAGGPKGLSIGKEIRKARSTRLYKAVATPDTSAKYAGNEALDSERSKVMKLIRTKYHEKNKQAVLDKVEQLFNKFQKHGSPEDAADMATEMSKAAAGRRKAEFEARKKALEKEAKFNAKTAKTAKEVASKKQTWHKLAKSAKPSQVAKVAAMKAAVPSTEATALKKAGVDVTKVMADHVKAPTVKEDNKAVKDAKDLKKKVAKEAVKIEKKLEAPKPM